MNCKYKSTSLQCYKLHSLLLFLIIFLNSLFSFANHSLNYYKTYNTNKSHIWFDLNYYKTTENYNDTSKINNLSSGYYLQTTKFTSGFRSVTAANLAFTAELVVANTTTYDNVTTRSNTGASHLILASDSRFYSGYFDTIGEVLLNIPFYQIDKNKDEALISDGDMSVSGKLILQKRFSFASFFSSLGYMYRDDNLAHLATYEFGGEMRTKSLLIGSRIFGFSPVKNDKYHNTPSQRNNLTTTVDAGSLKYFSVDPTHRQFEIYTKFSSHKKFAWVVGAITSMAGTNFAKGNEIYGGVLIYYSKRKEAPDLPTQEKSEPTLSSKASPTNSPKKPTSQELNKATPSTPEFKENLETNPPFEEEDLTEEISPE